MRLLVGLSCIVLAACNARPLKKDFTEGTRLAAVYQQAEGAPPRFVGWYDTVLGTDCLFADVGLPERLVCFPTNAPFEGFNTLFAEETAFSTSDGAEPLVALRGVPGPNPPRFYARAPALEAPCGTQVHLFSLGPEVTDPAAIVSTDSTRTPPERGLYRLGAEIPFDTLVTGTYQPGAGPGRIVPLTIVASDGSVQVAGTKGRFQGFSGGEAYANVVSRSVAWDTERREMVSADFPPFRSEIRWYPLEDYPAWNFADVACSVPVALGPACGVRAREATFVVKENACGARTLGFQEVGAQTADPTVYSEGVNDACVPLGPPYYAQTNFALAAYQLGAAVAPTAFADAMEMRTGTQQLQLIQAGSTDGPVAFPLGFFDTVHGAPCRPQLLEGACLPDAIQAQDDVFADAACSVPLVPVYPYLCPLESPATTFVGRTESPSEQRHIYRLGERHPGPVYTKGTGACALVVFESPAARPDFFSIGPEVPLSEFATIELVRPN